VKQSSDDTHFLAVFFLSVKTLWEQTEADFPDSRIPIAYLSFTFIALWMHIILLPSPCLALTHSLPF
jgi:hypothetical protein